MNFFNFKTVESLLAITGSAFNLDELLFPDRKKDKIHIDFNNSRTTKFYLTPIFEFEIYKNFVNSLLEAKQTPTEEKLQFNDELLKRAAWITGGVHRQIVDRVEQRELFIDAAAMEGNKFKWSLKELIDKYPNKDIEVNLLEPSDLWLVLQFFDSRAPSGEVILFCTSYLFVSPFKTLSQCNFTLLNI
jgi:hypothetical protein